MVDEYQDTNTAQFKFVSLLASKYKNLCVVGDDDQSIYKFRGANIGNILGYEKVYTHPRHSNFFSPFMMISTVACVTLFPIGGIRFS